MQNPFLVDEPDFPPSIPFQSLQHPPHIFPHPPPSSSTGVYPFSPPASGHKGTARRNRIVSRDQHLQARAMEGGWTTDDGGDGAVGKWDVPSTGGRRRRGRAVDCIHGLPTPPQSKNSRFNHQSNQHPPGFVTMLPPTPASTVRTKRTVNYRIVSDASDSRDQPSLRFSSIQEEEEEESQQDVQQLRNGGFQTGPSWTASDEGPVPIGEIGRTRRTGLMFVRQMGTDGVWHADGSGHQFGSGLSGKRKAQMQSLSSRPMDVRPQEPSQEEGDLVDTDREGTPDPEEDPNDLKKKSGHILLSAPAIPGMRKGNSFLQQLEAVAEEKKREEQERVAESLLPRTNPLRRDATEWNPFHDGEVAPKPARRPLTIKGRMLSFGDDSETSDDEEFGGRRLPSPAGMINFTSTKPSLSRSSSSYAAPPFSLKPPCVIGNPFDEPDAPSFRLPEAGPSSPTPSPASGGRNKRVWRRPVAGGEDDPFAERPGDLERMKERQRKFVRRPEGSVMEFTFRGHKTSAPNPLYGLDATPFMARLPPSHPEFSPAPIPRPKFLLDELMEQAKNARQTPSCSSSDDEGVQASTSSVGRAEQAMRTDTASSLSKRQSQSILGKRSRSDDEDQSNSMRADVRSMRSVSEQALGSPNPETPARKRVRSSMHPISRAGEARSLSGTPRSTVRKTGLHRL